MNGDRALCDDVSGFDFSSMVDMLGKILSMSCLLLFYQNSKTKICQQFCDQLLESFFNFFSCHDLVLASVGFILTILPTAVVFLIQTWELREV